MPGSHTEKKKKREGKRRRKNKRRRDLKQTSEQDKLKKAKAKPRTNAYSGDDGNLITDKEGILKVV